MSWKWWKFKRQRKYWPVGFDWWWAWALFLDSTAVEGLFWGIFCEFLTNFFNILQRSIHLVILHNRHQRRKSSGQLLMKNDKKKRTSPPPLDSLQTESYQHHQHHHHHSHPHHPYQHHKLYDKLRSNHRSHHHKATSDHTFYSLQSSSSSTSSSSLSHHHHSLSSGGDGEASKNESENQRDQQLKKANDENKVGGSFSFSFEWFCEWTEILYRRIFCFFIFVYFFLYFFLWILSRLSFSPQMLIYILPLGRLYYKCVLQMFESVLKTAGRKEGRKEGRKVVCNRWG